MRESRPVPSRITKRIRVKVMTIERVKHSGAYVISEIVGEGSNAYLFTRTYYGYTLAQSKAQFNLAVEHEVE